MNTSETLLLSIQLFSFVFLDLEQDSCLQSFLLHYQTFVQVNSKKYGVDLIRFSHNTSNAIHCSTKVDGRLNVFLCGVATS